MTSNQGKVKQSNKDHIFLDRIAYYAYTHTHKQCNNVQHTVTTYKWYETCSFHFCCSNIGLIKSVSMLPNVHFMHFIYHTPYAIHHTRYTGNNEHRYSQLEHTISIIISHASSRAATEMVHIKCDANSKCAHSHQFSSFLYLFR